MYLNGSYNDQGSVIHDLSEKKREYVGRQSAQLKRLAILLYIYSDQMDYNVCITYTKPNKLTAVNLIYTKILTELLGANCIF